MKWRKLGQIYQPSGMMNWAHSHAANPIVEHIEDDFSGFILVLEMIKTDQV